MTIVVTTDEDLRRIVREELQPVFEAIKQFTIQKPNNEIDGYLTVEQVAERCGVSSVTVRRWIHKGSLRAKQAERRYLVQSSDLDAFLLRETSVTISPDLHLEILKKRLNGAGST